MGFTRRFGSTPGIETIRQVEGIVIVDQAPPGAINGVGAGTVGVVGEFADMGNATAVSSTGVVSTKVVPVEVFTSQDMLNKVGGWDESLGQFGKAQGSGFLAIRNKRFSRLVLFPVNFASAEAARFFRSLPLCRTPTDSNPVVPVQGGIIAAGREFRSGPGRIRVAKKVVFTARPPIARGVGGATVAAGAAATQVFDATGGFDWTLIDRGDGSLGARKGDILVIGNNNAGAKQPVAEAGTYRVFADPVSGVAITLERLDGVNFTFTAQATVPWRLHHSTDADSSRERVVGSSAPGGYVFSETGGYIVPVRPLTDQAGTSASGTWTAGSLITPAVTPPALTGSSADSLSGLGGALHPVTATDFTTGVQLSNAANSAAIDALYAAAIDAVHDEDDPARDVNIMYAARKSSNIRVALKTAALTRSAAGRGLTTTISPQLDTLDTSSAIADADPGVGANRNERVDYSWPGCQHFVPEAVGFLLGTADGGFTDDGVLDESFDGWLAAIESNLAPERNPGQPADPIPTVLAPVLGFQRGVGSLGIGDYIAFRAAGVAALRIDRTTGPVIHSGITTSLLNGEKNINRRRMADFIEDSLADALQQFNKLPITQDLKDTVFAETVAFLDGLLSPSNPAAQRIVGYTVDDKSGNTPELEAQGIFVLIVKVRTLATADFIVLNAQVAEGVDVEVTQLAA